MPAAREHLEQRLAELEQHWRRAAESAVAAQAEVDALRDDNKKDLEPLRRATAKLRRAQLRKRALAAELEAIEDQLD